MSIGERIIEARKSKNMSQNQLARLANISQSGLSSIEKGLVSPKEETLRLLAAALNTTVSALMGETPAPIEASATLWHMADQTYINQKIGSLSSEEADLIQLFRAAESTARAYALDLLRAHPLPASKANRV